MRRLVVSLGLAAVLGLTGCGGGGDDDDAAPAQTTAAPSTTAAVKGRTEVETRDLIRAFKAMMSIHERGLDGNGEVTDGAPVAPDPAMDMGELEALRGVVKFPVRIKCATLSWNTLAQAFDAAGLESTRD